MGLSRKGGGGKSALFILLLVALVLATLLMLSPTIIISSASPENTEYFVFVSPTRIQEGLNTNITVSLQEASVNTTFTFKINVTAPDGVSYSANVTVETDGTGAGSNVTEFWRGFERGNTDLVGTYNITLYNLAGNETYATANFSVGLTDTVKYLTSETVNIRGSGYDANETVLVDLKFGNTSVSSFPQYINASEDGVINLSWLIPSNASLGVYSLTLTNTTTGGTVKRVPDSQDFTIEAICEIQTKNLADEPLGNVTVEVYNATSGEFLNLSQETNENGWTRFQLSAGNYTFKALWNNVEVYTENQTIVENKTLFFSLRLTNMRIIVRDVDGALPFIDLRFSFNYTTRANEPKSEVLPIKTNISGVAEISNVFANLSYLLEAWRYGFPLPGTPIVDETSALGWNNVTILVPQYTALIQVLDSKGMEVSDITIAAYESTSGTTLPVQTQISADGTVTFFLTFGRYRLRALDDSLLLNETTLDLIEDNLNFTFHLIILNTDVTVLVRDYFGQPIANAEVTIERKFGEEYVLADSQFTGSDGSTTFFVKVGGDSRVSVYVGGKLVAVKTQFLSGAQSSVEFRVGEYIAILGYPIPTGLFALLVFFVLVIVMALVLARGRLTKALGKKRRR